MTFVGQTVIREHEGRHDISCGGRVGASSGRRTTARFRPGNKLMPISQRVTDLKPALAECSGSGLVTLTHRSRKGWVLIPWDECAWDCSGWNAAQQTGSVPRSRRTRAGPPGRRSARKTASARVILRKLRSIILSSRFEPHREVRVPQSLGVPGGSAGRAYQTIGSQVLRAISQSNLPV